MRRVNDTLKENPNAEENEKARFAKCAPLRDPDLRSSYPSSGAAERNRHVAKARSRRAHHTRSKHQARYSIRDFKQLSRAAGLHPSPRVSSTPRRRSSRAREQICAKERLRIDHSRRVSAVVGNKDILGCYAG